MIIIWIIVVEFVVLLLCVYVGVCVSQQTLYRWHLCSSPWPIRAPSATRVPLEVCLVLPCSHGMHHSSMTIANKMKNSNLDHFLSLYNKKLGCHMQVTQLDHHLQATIHVIISFSLIFHWLPRGVKV